MGRAYVVGLVVWLVACRPPQPAYIAVRGGEVTAHLEALRRDGEARLATVMVMSGKDMRPADVETVFFYQTVTVDGATTSIEALAAGCTLGTEPDCELARRVDAMIKLRDLAHGDPKEAKASNVPAIAFGSLAIASLVGGVYCLAECDSDKGLKAGGLGLGTLVFGIVAYALSGGTIRD